jgi:Fe-S-cluster-containing hydrogenase component 2
MSQGIVYTGVPSLAELEASPGYPSQQAMERQPLAIIECVQQIPCNPCETVCAAGAITVGEPITSLPRLDASKCSGCGLCIAICPGQAIFGLDLTYSPSEATVSFPYEFLPMPRKGDLVAAVDREGTPVCHATVLRVAMPAAYDRTAVITVVVPREHGTRVRSIQRISPARN